MPSYLDIENWKRKAQFYFFKDYDYPFFNICTDVDVTSLVGYTKERNRSFFITLLYLSLKTVNEIAEFRYRIRGNKVVVHELIHGGSTVLNEDETFRFCYFAYHPTFKQFTREASRVLKQNPNTGRSLDPQDERDDLIHYSMIPWISFTSFSHARRFHCSDSIPKIVFGKFYRENACTKMPVSVEVHHSLMDGIHVGKYFAVFQSYLDCPQEFLNG